VLNAPHDLDATATQISRGVSVRQFRAPGCRDSGTRCRPLLRVPVLSNGIPEQQRVLDQTWQDLLGPPGEPGGCDVSFYDFIVHYDGHDVLSLTVRSSGWGAYPAMGVQVFNFKASGERLRARDVFLASATEPVLAMLRRRQQTAIDEARVGLSATELREFEGLLQRPDGSPRRFAASELDQFVVEPFGLRFYYDFGFPHAVEALTPSSEYFVSYRELGPHLDPSGALGWARP